MIEETARFAMLLVAAIGIVLIAGWLLAMLWQQAFAGDVVSIDQFTVVRGDGKSDDDFGRALAQGLQARLPLLGNELRQAQEELRRSPTASDQASVAAARLNLGLSSIIAPEKLSTTLFERFDIKLSLAGVDVGGIFPWFQRQFTKSRTLRFTVSIEENEAEIYGALDALGLQDVNLHLPVEGEANKPPGLKVIVDRLAHEILHKFYLAKNANRDLESLDPKQFQSLADVLVSAAVAKKQAEFGRRRPDDFAGLAPKISALADTAPNWKELRYLTAWIEDNAGDKAAAISSYQQVRPMLLQASESELVDVVDQRIAFLRGVVVTVSSTTPTDTPTLARTAAEAAAALASAVSSASSPVSSPVSQDARELDLSAGYRVRNNGEEASGVGQALAGALAFKIARTGLNKEPSARFIYNGARELEGTVSTDSGAVLRDGLRVLADQGTVEESVWPYVAGKYKEGPPPAVSTAQKFKISKFYVVKPTIENIKSAIINNPPVVAGITLFSEFYEAETMNSGIIPVPGDNSKLTGAEAVVLLGFDDTKRQFKFANNWGQGWGDKGFGYLPYDYVTANRVEAWAFDYP